MSQTPYAQPVGYDMPPEPARTSVMAILSLVLSLICFFIFHILINVSMQIGLLPVTGIPLPLISYGGSATMMFFMAIGLIQNVGFRRFVNV